MLCSWPKEKDTWHMKSANHTFEHPRWAVSLHLLKRGNLQALSFKRVGAFARGGGDMGLAAM